MPNVPHHGQHLARLSAHAHHIRYQKNQQWSCIRESIQNKFDKKNNIITIFYFKKFYSTFHIQKSTQNGFYHSSITLLHNQVLQSHPTIATISHYTPTCTSHEFIKIYSSNQHLKTNNNNNNNNNLLIEFSLPINN
jgi:branched-subunit amino acid aminotransferase/4-amino-4-deoxychorismate lyase